MVTPSKPLGGAGCESKGRENRNAEEDAVQVKHGGSFGWYTGDCRELA
jgi:hypothetical protein